MERVQVKLCGTTSVADRDLAAEFAADFFGVVVEVPWSERSRTRAEAAALLAGATIPGVLLFCDAPVDALLSAAEEIRPFAMQLQGSEPPETVSRLSELGETEVWKVLHLPTAGVGLPDVEALCQRANEFIAAGVAKLLLDSVSTAGGVTRLGGTGLVHDWVAARQIVASLPCPVWLSGGISPANVKAALEQVRPYGVDLASGVESVKGKRDRKKVQQLMSIVKRWRAQEEGS